MSLVIPTGRHRLTLRTRAVRVWTRVRYMAGRVRASEVALILAGGILVAASGFATGLIWDQVF